MLIWFGCFDVACCLFVLVALVGRLLLDVAWLLYCIVMWLCCLDARFGFGFYIFG